MSGDPFDGGASPFRPAQPFSIESSSTALADQVARSLRRLHAGTLTDLAVLPALGVQAVPRVRRALERRARAAVVRRRLARGGALAAAVALASTSALIVGQQGDSEGRRRGNAGALVVLGANQLGGAAAGIVRSGRGEHGAPTLGMALATGARVMAPSAGELRMGTPDGTSLTLEAGGAMTIVEQNATRRFLLAEGAVRARVAKLAAGERFLITTADAEVEVHGTAFRVAMAAPDAACGAGTRTRVFVDEGVVSVRSQGTESRVPAGGRWPVNCGEAPAGAGVTAARAGENPFAGASGTARTTRTAVARRPAPAARVPAAQTPSLEDAVPAGAPSGALAIQNDLLLGAMRAQRQGRARDAERLLGELIARFPDGALAEAAMAQRMRTLTAYDRRAATTAAERYLARFPRGFARDEARRLTVGP